MLLLAHSGLLLLESEFALVKPTRSWLPRRLALDSRFEADREIGSRWLAR